MGEGWASGSGEIFEGNLEFWELGVELRTETMLWVDLSSSSNNSDSCELSGKVKQLRFMEMSW